LDGESPNKMKIKQLHALRKAIQRWGFIVPIVTNRDLLVVDGEQRAIAAKGMYLASVKREPRNRLLNAMLRPNMALMGFMGSEEKHQNLCFDLMKGCSLDNSAG